MSGTHETSQVLSGNDDLCKKLATETLFLRLVRQMKVKRVYEGRGLERGRLARAAAAAAVKLRYVVYSNVPSSLWRARLKNLLQCVSVRPQIACSIRTEHGYQTPCTKIQPRAELTMELSPEDKLANNKKFSPQRQVGIMARSVGSPFFSNSSAAAAKGLHSRIAEDQRAALLAFRSRCFGILATRKEGNFGLRERERGTAVKAE